MPTFQTLELIAKVFRSAIENADRSSWGPLWQRFPNGSCGVAAETLAIIVIELTGSIPTYVSGLRSDQSQFHSHAWIEVGGVIIDVTADQFGEDSVIVTLDAAWHDQFNDRRETRHVDRSSGWWREHCLEAFRTAMKPLRSMNNH